MTDEVLQSHETFPPLRRTDRVITRPIRFKDYICQPTSTTNNSLSNSFLAQCLGPIPHLPTDFIHSFALMANIPEPTHFSQGKLHTQWISAMQSKIEALEKNQTWFFTDLPHRKKVIGCKWIYKIKYNPDETVQRYKARLVAKGYNQIKRKDYIILSLQLQNSPLSEFLLLLL